MPLTPFLPGPVGVAAQHHPNPLEHCALLPRQVRCPRPRCPQRLRLIPLLHRLVASLASHCVGLQNYLWEHRIPYKDLPRLCYQPGGYRSRLEEAPLRLASGNTVARSATLNSASTPQGRHRSGRSALPLRPRPHQVKGLICVLCAVSIPVCRSRSTRTTGRTNSRSSTANARVPSPAHHHQIHPIFGLHAHPASRTWFPSASTSASTRREWLARQMDKADCAHCAAATNTFTWLEDLDQARRPCSTSGRRPTGRSCWTPAALAANLREVGDPKRGFPATTTTGRSVTVHGPASVSCSPRPRKALATVYPRLLRCCMPSPRSAPVDVMRRFLGQLWCRPAGKVPYASPPRDQQQHQVNAARSTDQALAQRQLAEDVRQSVPGAAWKTLIRESGDFKVYRTARKATPRGPRSGGPCCKGLRPRRASGEEVSQADNGRYRLGA